MSSDDVLLIAEKPLSSQAQCRSLQPLSFPRLRGNQKGASPLAGESEGGIPASGDQKGVLHSA